MKTKIRILIAVAVVALALLWNDAIGERGWDWNFCAVSKISTDPDYFTDMVEDGWEPVCETKAFGRDVILLKRRQPWFPFTR